MLLIVTPPTPPSSIKTGRWRICTSMWTSKPHCSWNWACQYVDGFWLTWWDARAAAKEERVPINLKLAWRGHANRFSITLQNKEGPDDPYMYPSARAGFIKWLLWAKNALSSWPLKLCWVFSGGCHSGKAWGGMKCVHIDPGCSG